MWTASGSCRWRSRRVRSRMARPRCPLRGRSASVCSVPAPPRHDVIGRLASPRGPPRARVAREELQARSGAAGLDDLVGFVGLSRVLALAGGEQVGLTPARGKGPKAPANPEEQQLGDVAEVEADPPP